MAEKIFEILAMIILSSIMAFTVVFRMWIVGAFFYLLFAWFKSNKSILNADDHLYWIEFYLKVIALGVLYMVMQEVPGDIDLGLEKLKWGRYGNDAE